MNFQALGKQVTTSSLLIENPVRIKSENIKNLEIYIPNLREIFLDDDLTTVIDIVQADYEQIKELNAGFTFKNEIQFLCGYYSYVAHEFDFHKQFNRLFSNLKITKTGIYSDEHQLSLEEYLEMRKILLIGLGRDSLDDKQKGSTAVEEEELSDDPMVREFQLKERELNKRVEEANAKKENKEGTALVLENMLIAILNEFPSYKLCDLYELNMFTINYLFDGTIRSLGHKISLHAIGHSSGEIHTLHEVNK